MHRLAESALSFKHFKQFHMASPSVGSLSVAPVRADKPHGCCITIPVPRPIHSGDFRARKNESIRRRTMKCTNLFGIREQVADDS